MGLKEAYFAVEDAYYAALDKVNEVVPVYKVIDPIDRVIPSLILFVVIILGLAGGALLLSQQQLPPSGGLATVILEFKDKDSRQAIAGGQVTVMIEGKRLSLTTSQAGRVEFEAREGQSAGVSFSASGYSTLDQNIVVEREFFRSFLVSAVAAAEKDREMFFADDTGKVLDGKLVTVYFSCSSGAKFPQPVCAAGSLQENNSRVMCTTSNGQIKVLGKAIPKDCGKLIARASLAGYNDKDFEVGDGSTIRFEALQGGKGNATIIVKNELGIPIEGAKVSLYDKDNLLTLPAKLTVAGRAEFTDLGIGTYYASAEKENYTNANTQPFQVKSNETASMTIFMASVAVPPGGGDGNAGTTPPGSTSAALNVWVKDKQSSAPIAGATVTLRNSIGQFMGNKGTDANGYAKYDVAPGVYRLAARMDTNYLGAEVDLNLQKGDNNSTLQLEKMTPLNSGILLVRVTDEDDTNVSGAEVFLYNYASGKKGFLANYDSRYTDSTGTAKWTGVEEKTFVAHARKGIAEGDSQPFTIAKAVQNNATVRITIGETTLDITANDRDGRPVPNASVEFRTIGGALVGTILLGTNGTATHRLKADKTVYAAVSAPNYLPWVSQSIELKPDDIVALNAVLQPRYQTGKPKLDFLGAFETSASKNPTTELKAGNSYLLKWSLQVPERGPGNETLAQVGVHVRAGKSESGKQNLMENDSIYFSSVGTPSNPPLKGTTYSPGTANAYAFDSANTTGGDFKWANITMDNASSAQYTITAVLKVRDSAQLGESLMLNWRAWAKTASGSYVTSPDDASASGLEQLFYANTDSREYIAGTATACNSDLCYTGERLLDNERMEIVKSSSAADSIFSVRPNASNTLTFTLLSNSDNTYANALFYIRAVDYSGVESDAVKIRSYKIIDSGNVPHQASFIAGSEPSKIEAISAGSAWKRGGKLQADINFALVREEATVLEIYVLNNASHVKINGNEKKEITIRPAPAKTMGISVFPSLLYPGIAQDLNVTVRDDKGIELSKALVSISQQLYSQRTQFAQAETGTDGNAQFRIPASYLVENASIRVSAAKVGYSTAESTVGLSGSGAVASIDPQRITASVNPTQQIQEVDVTIRNNAFFALDLNDLKIVQSSSTTESQLAWGQYLDVDAMDNAVASYARSSPPIKIAANSSVTQKFFMARLRSESVTPSKALGTLRFVLKEPGSGARWTKEVPIEINVGYAGQALDSTNCLTIDKSDWTAATLSTIATQEFKITNNCTSNGSPIQLQNLKATVKWNGNILGNVQLKLDDPQTNQSITQALRQNSSALFYPIVEKGSQASPKEYLGTLTFNPFTGTVGQTAKFSVQIRAELSAQTAPVQVRTDRDISGQIGIIDLKQCVSLSPSPYTGITIGDGSPSTFTVSAACGSASIGIRLCANDNGCRGGTSEGGITVTPTEFTLSPGTTSQTVNVSKQTIAGMYGVTVQARAPGGSWIDLPTKTMKVTVNPSGSQYFSMDKYEFNVPDTNEKDIAFLTNTGYQRKVNVSASKCDWKTAQEKTFGQHAMSVLGTTVSGAAAGAAIGSVIPGVGTAIGAVVGAAIGFVGGMLNALFGSDPCDDFETHQLVDYQVNLSGKGLASPTDPSESKLEVDLPGSLGGQIVADGFNTDVWEFDGTGSDGLPGEKVGVQVRNVSANSSAPIYGMMTVKGTKYDYTDPVMIERDQSDKLRAYELHKNLNGEGWTHTVSRYLYGYSQKFHVRFNTAQQEQDRPTVLLGAVSCVEGVKQGYSGSAALPKTKTNWGWNDSTGIRINECDENNASGIYCDATQLSIELSKRVNALDEFLKANNYSFLCPTNPLQAGSSGNQSSTTVVPSGTLGIQYAAYEFAGRNLTLHVDVNNDTSGAITPSLSATITPPTGALYNDALAKSANFSFPSKSLTRYDFNFFDLNSGTSSSAYKVDLTLGSGSGITPATITLTFALEQSQTCWLPRSTQNFNNTSPLEMYINKNHATFGKYVNQPSVVWTAAVPNIEALRDLTHFHARLMKDGYGRDFQKDFADYYTSVSFADTPTFFSNTTNGLAKYFGQTSPYILSFSRKYSSEAKLSAPGLYNVDIDISYGDDWRLFDAQGNPKAQIDVKFYLLSQPYPDSAFYYLPFDGMVGLQPSTDNLQRDGYGIAYNLLEGGAISINSDLVPVQARVSSGSSNNQVVDVKTVSDIRVLNTDIATRGNLLSLTTRTSDGVKELFMSPGTPTPVMLKVTHAVTNNPFNAFYTVYNQSVQAVNTGDTFTYWNGAGACLDFSGATVQEAFQQKADQKAGSADGLVGSVSTYKAHWDAAAKGGTEYLKTIIYTPASGYTAKASSPDTYFVTPASENQTVSLNGIGIASQRLSSISSLLQMVSDNTACLTDSGTNASIWWNPKAVYEAKTANNTSVWDIEQSLGSSQRQCIQ